MTGGIDADWRCRQRARVLAVPAALLLLPPWLRWSRRSARLLRMLAVVDLVGLAAGNGSGRLPALVASASGLTLALAQFELTEEESSVRGLIAGLGLLQAGLACLPGLPPRGGRRVD
ncbi:MAG TPA: hypothetical protein VFI42_02520 [Thermomicrobiaceae bacterium]|nr:hypothetical protein [Thermomicrobiaceae bacterium]